jgi:hypothetical protein
MLKGIRPNPANTKKIYFLFVIKGLLTKYVSVTEIDSMQFFKDSAQHYTEPNGTEKKLLLARSTKTATK